MDRPKGIIPALNTLTTDTGDLDLPSLKSLVHRNLEWGVHGFAVSIVAGEFYKFTDEERKKTFQAVVEECDGKVPVWAGVSHLGTQPALELSKYAKKVGADGIIAMPGVVSKESSFSVYEHFETILKNVDIPLMIQDSDDFNGIHMSATLFDRLAKEFSNFVAVKVEGEHSLEKIQDIKTISGRRLAIISGRWAMKLFEELKLGAEGNIPDGCLSDLLVKAYDCYVAGNFTQANHVFARYKRWIDFIALHMLSSPEIEKETLRCRGVVSSSNTRLPRVELGEEAKIELKDLLRKLEIGAS